MISLSALDLAVIGLYLGATVAVGMGLHRFRGGDAEAYLVAGRRVSLPAFVATLVATWYGGILGVGEFTYTSGLYTWLALGIPYYIFAILFALFLAGPVRRAALYTIPDRLAQSFGKGPAVLGSVFVFVLVSPAPYVLMLGVLLQIVIGWSLPVCVLVGTLFSTFYVARGGLSTDIRVNIFQFLLMFAGFGVILPAAALKYGGPSFLTANLPPELLRLEGTEGFQRTVVWFLIAVWTLVDPGFHQRCYAAKSEDVARRGIFVAVCCWLVFDFLTIATGLYARAALPGLNDPKMSYPLLAEAVLPAGLKGFFYVGMLATIMSTVLSYTFLGAVTLGRDVVWRLRGDRDESRLTLYTRGGILVTGALAVALAIAIPSVVQLWYTLGSVCVPGLIIPVLNSYFGRRRMTAAGCSACMAIGAGTALAWLVSGLARAVDGWPQYPLGIEPMLPGLAASLVVYLVSPRRQA
ncbi:MAG: sodium:solute symporter family protein [Armatimonadota bacterium]